MTKENMYLLQNSLLLNQKTLSDKQFNFVDITKVFKLSDNITIEEVDLFITKKIKEYKEYLISIELDINDISVLFVVEDTLVSNEILNIKTDEEILKELSKYDRSEAGVKYCQIMIDHYQVSYFSRFKKISPFKYYGQITEEQLNSHNNVISLLNNSVYYKSIKDDRPEKIDKLFDEYLITEMKKYQYHNIGINGIFSNVFFKMMELKNIRIVLKSHLNHLSYIDMVRELNG